MFSVLFILQGGQFQLLEQGAMTPSSMMIYQVHTEGAPIGAFDIGASCNAYAFGDHGGKFGKLGPVSKH